MDKGKVFMRPAIPSDHTGILLITSGEDLWDGCDYLPSVLEDWLEEEEVKGKESKVRSFVFILVEEIVGFRSLNFQSENCAVKFAFRVKKKLRGKGYGREMRNIFEDHLEKCFPKNLVTLSCVPDWDLTDNELKSRKYGDLLLVRPYMVVCFKPSGVLMRKVEDLPQGLKVISNEEFKHVLKNKNVQERLLESNILHIDFTPIVLDSEEAIEYATDKDQTVMVEGSVDNPTSFSIFTNPYPVPNDRKCSGLDIFCENIAAYKNHFLSQIQLYKSNVKNQADDATETFLDIFCKEDQIPCMVETSNNLFGSGNRITYGSKNREVTRMYIYKKTYN